MRLLLASSIVLAAALPAAAQKTYEIRQPTGPWRVPGEIQTPRTADPGLRQDQAGSAEYHRGRPGRSRRPPEEPPRRSRVRHVPMS
jgi:hypothetical protein